MIYSILLVILVFILYILNIVLYIYKNNNRECFSNTSPYDITFIINLSETQEGRRRWNIIKNMSEFYNKIRFPAIYGKTYDYSEEIKKDIIKTEWDYGKWKYNKSKMISFDKGEIGVALSHYYIWKKIVDEDIDVALILEDDAINIHTEFEKHVKDTMKILPDDWDILLLGFWLHKGDNKKNEVIKNKLYKVDEFVLLHSYIINKKGAEKLLNRGAIDMPIDSWISAHSDTVHIYRHNILRSNTLHPSSNLIRQKRAEKQIKNTNNW